VGKINFLVQTARVKFAKAPLPAVKDLVWHTHLTNPDH